jgi:hypothetical protein
MLISDRPLTFSAAVVIRVSLSRASAASSPAASIASTALSASPRSPAANTSSICWEKEKVHVIIKGNSIEDSEQENVMDIRMMKFAKYGLKQVLTLSH